MHEIRCKCDTERLKVKKMIENAEAIAKASANRELHHPCNTPSSAEIL